MTSQGTAYGRFGTLCGREAINLQPVWVADLLRGLSAAYNPEPARVNDRECQRYSATTDINRVADSAPHKVLMPWGGTAAYVDQARELPLTVYNPPTP